MSLLNPVILVTYSNRVPSESHLYFLRYQLGLVTPPQINLGQRWDFANNMTNFWKL